MRGHVVKRTARAPPRMRASTKRPATRRPMSERPAELAALWMRVRRREWMTEDAARAFRRPSLLQDNPTSG